jgi:HSP20 family protein
MTTTSREEESMLRFDPFREFDRLARDTRERTPSVMAFDAVRDDEAVTLYFDVPGVSGDDLDVSVNRNELTITAERVWSGDDKEVLVTERPQGSFSRRVLLSDALDMDRLEANLADGVLTVTVPLAERSKPRRIDVDVRSDRGEIDVSGGK